MEVVAFYGPPGTGKSDRALVIAYENQCSCIIDDGILIYHNRIVAGKSAKREESRLKAVRRAIFWDEEQREDVKKTLQKIHPDRILILGTSDRMVVTITKALDLPEPSKYIRIEDVARPEEMMKASEARHKEGKHVIPVPVIELKPHFTGYWIDSLQVLFRRKGRFSAEKSIVRPKFSYHGTLTISNTVIQSIAQYVTQMEEGVVKAEASSASVQKLEEKVLHIKIQIAAKHGILLVPLCKNVQEKVKTMIEYMTGMTVEKVDVSVKSLVVVP